MEKSPRNVEYKLSAIIGSCLNQEHLQIARMCVLRAIENQIISPDCAAYCKEALLYREQYINSVNDDMSNAVQSIEDCAAEIEKERELAPLVIESDGTCAE